MPFYCTICEQQSRSICVACTKDTCDNHLCAKCRRCSDCCTCELMLDDQDVARPAVRHDAPFDPEIGD